MPTARPRHQITETPAVAHAIDRAAQRWPGERRSRLLLRLLEAGTEALERNDRQTTETHRRAIMSTSGKYAEAFEPGYLPALRRDWPA